MINTNKRGGGRIGAVKTADDTITIAPGVEMPMLGFGTWKLHGDDAYDATLHALRHGYRHIDTATLYGNEAQVGRALKDSGIARDDVFVTTKLPPDRIGAERATLDASLRALGVDHVDLWLIHWPPNEDPVPDTWKQFIAVRDAGLARAIGVSNYDPRQLDALTDATGVTPTVNQVYWNPKAHDPAVLAGHRKRGVVLEGYSGLRGANLKDKTLRRIAETHGVTPAQVILRWHLEHGIVIIPKSAHPDRIDANRDLFGFELTPDEVAAIDAMGT
jgi:2,5-diketo-D-gluconate reductase A